ncbi:MAG: hypothetical protein ACI9N0_002896 [Ilumatobacter sp.]|jgi:hypothetical protein
MEDVSVDATTPFSRRATMNWVEVGSEVVVVDSASADTHVMAGAAAIVWQLLDGVTLSELVEDVSGVFDIPESDAARDIKLALEDMLERGLIEQSEPRTT